MNGIGNNQVELGCVTIRCTTLNRALATVRHAVKGKSTHVFGFCNAHTVNLARSSKHFRAALSTMTVFNDGIGVDIGNRILRGVAFPDNLNGTDFVPALLACLPSGTKVYLLGGSANVAGEAAVILGAAFPNLSIVGYRNGFFYEEEAPKIADVIASTGAHLALIGMGQPRQELWSTKYAHRTGAVLVCVGAYLDFAAGRFPRAPLWLRRTRLEWLFRLLNEPVRLGRRYIIGNLSFLIYVIALRFK